MLLLMLILVSIVLVIFASLFGYLPINTDARWENWDHATATFENIATILALIIGAWWTYKRLFVTRADFARLGLSIVGKVFSEGDAKYLAAAFKVKNVGTVRVYIDQDSSGVSLSEYQAAGAAGFTEVLGEERGAALGFQRDEYIDPGEVISNSVLFAVPKEHAGVIGVTLKVFSRVQGDQWFVTSIVGPSATGGATIEAAIED